MRTGTKGYDGTGERGETGLHNTAVKQAPIPQLLPAPHSKASGAAFPGKHPVQDLG